ncbi:MAG TPA: hypothetical protein DIU20_12735 [Cryomorphaceae bacterium]|nr:hypothetical protein [Cryomorphaceae bacterium]
MYVDSITDLGIDLKGKRRGTVKVLCPRCSHRRKKKSEPCLTVNLQEGWYKCHNDDCDFKGTVAKSQDQEPRSYTIPEHRPGNLSERTLDYLTQERALSKEAIEYFKITESSEWFPQVERKRTAINFNYFREGSLVNIKFRDSQKNFKMAPGAELILYGLDNISGKEWAVITEGEFDALAYYTAGIYNACSVPNGSPGIKEDGSPAKMNLEFLENCYDTLKPISKIYLSFDQDAAGQGLLEEMSRRLGRHRIFIIDLPDGCKDANDVLISYEPAVLKECFNNARPYPVEGIERAHDLREGVRQLYEHGFPRGSKLDNYPDLNELISWLQGEFNLVTGFPGHGKSNWLDNICIDIAKEHGWKFGIFSAEKPGEYHTLELIQKLFGRSARKLSESEFEKAFDFIHEHFIWIKIDEVDITLSGLIAKAEELVMRYGINGFILDNWAYVEHKVPQGKTMEAYIGDCMTLIRRFCKHFNCSLFLVAHPRKPEAPVTSKWHIGDGYIVSGSAHFFNKVDNGFTVFRDFEKGITIVRVWKVRWWFLGKCGFAEFSYDPQSFRYEEFLAPTKDLTYEEKLSQKRGGFSGQPITGDDL